MAWVSVAVDALSTAGGGQEIYYTGADGTEIDIKRIDESIYLPFINGFGHRSFSEWMKTYIAHRLLTGNALCLRSKKSVYGLTNNVIEQFIPIYPGKYKPLVSSSGYELTGYQIDLNDGRRIQARVDDVMHFTQNTNFKPFEGVGNITKLRLIAETEFNADEFQSDFLKKGAAPSLIIEDPTHRTDEELLKRARLYRDQYEGREGRGRMMFLSGENAKAYTLQLPQKDIQFLESKEFNRQTILSLFGVSPEAVGLTKNSNRATTGHEINQFHKRVNQLLEEFELQINAQHVHRINPNIFMRFRKHITGDVTNIKRMIESGLITPNRGAELIGESVDESDEARNSYYIPSGLTPMSFNFEKPKDEQGESEDNEDDKNDEGELEKAEEKEKSKSLKLRASNEIDKTINPTRKFQIRYLIKSRKSRKTNENNYAYRFSKFFEEQGKRVIDRFKQQNKAMPLQKKDLEDVDIAYLLPRNEEDEALKILGKSLFTSGIVQAVRDVNEITESDVMDSIKNPFVRAAINRLGKRITRINETTRKEIESIILKGIDEGQTMAEIQTVLQNKFLQFSTHRSRLIARTESRQAWDEGARIAYTEIGVKKVDVVGCEGLSTRVGGDEKNSDCGVQDTPIELMGELVFHPNHIGAIVPSEEPL